MLMQAYGGLSSALVRSLLAAAICIPPACQCGYLPRPTGTGCLRLASWLTRLETGQFEPGWTETGYTVLGWDMTAPADNIHNFTARTITPTNSTSNSSTD
jgi:hypothetical protein